MSRPAGTALQVVLAVVVVLVLAVQVLVLPGLAADAARRYPEAASAQAPVLVLAVATLACVQVAAVCVMALLRLVAQSRIFDPAAYRYVDVFIGATATASALVLGTSSWVSATVGSPAWVSGVLLALVGAGVALLMVVMRALLHQATDQHAELAEVV
ncbi:DUF2975 domain-containing protein [Pseudokineococcus marinus]|uniref:DUF2975 domain-containing protein n=1 Tax=Pseudokineococcus marinus TaxID=351215 RepID=A0A849BM07_9ACTN|nr:DUF2975 domain-containing protein [Pseudokineococcus marinus]NNH22087.1 DUF2975 domain-containing protein [Pseudokineococcus marinus]